MAASGSPNSNRPRRDDGSSVAAGAIGRPSTSCVHTYARMHRAHKRLPANYFDEPCVDLGIYIRARYCRRVTGAGQPRSSSVRGDDLSLSAAASVRLVAYYCLRGHALDSFLPREDTQQIMSSSPELHVAIIVTTPLLRFTPRPPRPSFSREEVDGYVRESVCPARARKQRASQGSGWRLSAGRLASYTI